MGGRDGTCKPSGAYLNLKIEKQMQIEEEEEEFLLKACNIYSSGVLCCWVRSLVWALQQEQK